MDGSYLKKGLIIHSAQYGWSILQKKGLIIHSAQYGWN